MKGPLDPEKAGLTAADAAVLRRFLDEDGRLRQWPARRKIQLLTLRWLIAHFEAKRRYAQGEVDAILQDLHGFADWVSLRRELVDARLLDRTPNGAEYWRVPESSAQR